MVYPDTFEDFMFEPKPLTERDVEIAIEACGVCGSDVHTLTEGWNQAKLPVCVGHEAIGNVVAIGPATTAVNVGDRVGVGAQLVSDLTSNGAAITSYSPLSRAKIGPGRMVGIVGIGGLGHFGLLFAAALGAEVYAISHSPNKEADAKALGAKGFICTKNEGWNEPWRNNFDFVLNTTDATDRFDMTAYFSLLTINGTFHSVGISDKEFPPLRTQDIMGNGCSIAASHIGSREEVQEMLQLAAKVDIKRRVQVLKLGNTTSLSNKISWVETIDISEEGCKTAVEKVYNGDVRYRVRLVGYDKVLGNRE